MASKTPVLFLLAAFLLVSATNAYSKDTVGAPAPAPSKVPVASPPPPLVKSPTTPPPPYVKTPTTPPPPLVKPPTTPPPPVQPPSTSPPPVKPPTAPSPPAKPPTAPSPPAKPPTTSPAPSPAPSTPPMPKVKSKADCTPLCDERCKLHSRKNVCVRACVTCCDRCKCVPPGTYGNREMCGKCYTDMKTRHNKSKCP